MFGARGGLALLVPGKEFSQEIHRLQQRTSTCGACRAWAGWAASPWARGAGWASTCSCARMCLGQLEKLYLFATSQEVKGLEFNKAWSTFGLRLGLTLGAEFAL